MSSEAQTLFSVIFDHLPDGVFLIDPATSGIVDCNQAALDQIGMERSEVLHHSVLSLQRDVVGVEQWASICDAIRGRRNFVFVGQHKHKTGAEVPVEVNTSHFTFEGKEYFLSIARDIGTRLAIERAMINRDVQLRFALTEASDGLWDWNLKTNEVFFSPQLQRMLGYGPSEMVPTLATWADNIHPEDDQRVRTALQEHIDGLRERFDAEYRLRNRNGHYIWVHDRGRVCERDAQEQPTRVVGMVENVTDRKNTEQTLLALASHDVLTGLLNRRECERVLHQQINLCRRLNLQLGVCLLDLDHFKFINDQFGHKAGDRVLCKVAEVAKNFLRSSDFVFRWGGEEFLMVCTDIDRNGLAALAEDLRRTVASITWDNVSGLGAVTCSIGISIYPDHAQDPEQLFIAADSALYRAKAKGRNLVEQASTA